MVDSYSQKYLKYQLLTDKKLMVSFKPFPSRYCKKVHYCIFEPGTVYYDVAMKCKNGSTYWLEINWLCHFVREHDKQIISTYLT